MPILYSRVLFLLVVALMLALSASAPAFAQGTIQHLPTQVGGGAADEGNLVIFITHLGSCVVVTKPMSSECPSWQVSRPKVSLVSTLPCHKLRGRRYPYLRSELPEWLMGR
jgi:hypothetical protein